MKEGSSDTATTATATISPEEEPKEAPKKEEEKVEVKAVALAVEPKKIEYQQPPPQLQQPQQHGTPLTPLLTRYIHVNVMPPPLIIRTPPFHRK